MAEQWLQAFGRIPLGQRLILLMTTAAAVAIIVVTVLWAQRPDYAPLFGGLSTEDANAIVQRLQDTQTPYQLSDGGTAVLVPGTKVHELRMQMAAEGIPNGGGVGFEIFDRVNYGTTDYVQKVNYRRALEGELSRTISVLDQISGARVHLVMPERRLFAKDQEAARASVTLKLKGRQALGDGQVAGVVHLVASAVEGLSPERVTVVDTAGRVLYAAAEGDDNTRLINNQAGMRVQLEDRLRDRVLAILAPTLGESHLQVQVAAVLDFTQEETTEELYDPDVSLVRSEQRSKEQRSGSSSSGGAAGVAPDVGGGESNNSKIQNETINYELNKTIRHSIRPTGQVERLSVAVLVDQAVLTDAEGELLDEEARTTQLASYTTLAQQAVGFNAERGDTVEVVSIAFGGLPEVGEILEPTVVDQLKPYAAPATRYLLALLAVGMVILMVLRPLVKVVSSGVKMVPAPELALAEGAMEGLPKTVGELEQENAMLFEDMETEALMPNTREDVLRMAKENPRQAADLLKAWIEEG